MSACSATPTTACRTGAACSEAAPRQANTTAFRAIEREYKRRGPLPASLVDRLECHDNPHSQHLRSAGAIRWSAASDATLGTLLRPDEQGDPVHAAVDIRIDDWMVPDVVAYTVATVPGLIIIPNALTPSAQCYLAAASLEQWSREPNVSNLHAHWDVPDHGIWNAAQAQPDQIIPLKTDFPPSAPSSRSQPIKDGSLSVAAGYEASPSPSSVDLTALSCSELMDRMRWSSLGMQYNWSRQEYYTDRVAPIPPLLVALTRAIVGATAHLTHYTADQWRPQGGIINFYGPHDALMAHQDRSEVNMTAPLVSLSLGQDAVFLMGSQTREDTPTAFRVRSGDIILFGGPARLNFHGVPRIMARESVPEHAPRQIKRAFAAQGRQISKQIEQGTDLHMLPFTQPGTIASCFSACSQSMQKYLQSHRININVRQFQ